MFFQVRDTKLKIKLVEKKEYVARVSAINQFGCGEARECPRFLAVVPYGVPGRSSSPKVVQITNESCVVTWEKPIQDKNTPITAYVLEKQDK